MPVQIKRIYDPPHPGDGCRVLVDRLWPRGIAKANARIDEWLKDIAPSDELRKWFAHDPLRWPEFRKRYRAELKKKHEAALRSLAERARSDTVTLLYGAKDTAHNNAVVLKECISTGGE